MRRGQVAQRAGIGAETVRYYEQYGLLPDPPRDGNGYRRYDGHYVERIRFIKRAQELGFTLAETKDLLALRVLPGADRAEIRRQAEQKCADVEARIRDLERIRDALAHLVEACDGHGPVNDCPILEAMDGR